MFCLGQKKYKQELEQSKQKMTEQNEIVKQKDTELAKMKKRFETYKNHMNAKLIKKEEIIRKLGERWDSLENNFMRREEELGTKLDEMNNTQKELINKLKTENVSLTNDIERQKECIEKQNDKIRVHEEDLDRNKNEIKNLIEELNSREDALRKYIDETKYLKEQLELLEKEMTKLKVKITDSQHELEIKENDIKHLQCELNAQKEQNRELEKDFTALGFIKNKLEAENKIEIESLKSIIEATNNEVENKTHLLANIERDLEKANKQNISLKEKLEEMNKHITEYKNDILGKEVRIRDLQLQGDNANQDIIRKVKLIKTIELQNKVLEREHKEYVEAHAIEKQKMEDSISKLSENILENEKTIKMRDENYVQLEKKLNDLEQAIKNTELKYKKEFQNSQNQFLNMVQSKNMIIETLEASEKRAHENLAQASETLLHLENEMKRTELNLSIKEKQIEELKESIKDILKRNEVLQYMVEQSESSKSEELDKLEMTLKEQVQLVNAAYQKELEIKKHGITEFMRDIEFTIRKQIANMEYSIKSMDHMQQTIDQFVNSTNQKVEAFAIKIDQYKNDRESLQKLVNEKEHQTREMKEELVQKDNMCEKLKRQVDDSLKLLLSEILKSDINLMGLGSDSTNDENSTPTMETILRQIHTRNVFMEELRAELQTKHNALIRIQEKYQKLSDKIKRVVITVSNAKFAYEKLEKENKILRKSLRGKQMHDTVVHERRDRETNTQSLLETFSDYVIQVGKVMDMSTVVNHVHQQCSNTSPFYTVPEDQDCVREESRKHILKLGLQSGSLKNIDHLKSEVQRERKLRKRQEALFSSVLTTLKSASACSQPDDTDNGDASFAE